MVKAFEATLFCFLSAEFDVNMAMLYWMSVCSFAVHGVHLRLRTQHPVHGLDLWVDKVVEDIRNWRIHALDSSEHNCGFHQVIKASMVDICILSNIPYFLQNDRSRTKHEGVLRYHGNAFVPCQGIVSGDFLVVPRCPLASFDGRTLCLRRKTVGLRTRFKCALSTPMNKVLLSIMIDKTIASVRTSIGTGATDN